MSEPPLLPSTTILDLTDNIIRSDHQYCEAGGSFADVFRCWYKGNDGVKEVAVKVFRFTFTVDEHSDNKKKDARMIRRELGIWSRLSHRNIVPFLGIAHGFGRQGNTSLVSVWMPNGTLHMFLEAHDHQLAVAHRLQLLLDIANGLEHLHSFSIVHGDLSSNNVLLDHKYNACLSDFGCASLVGKLPEGFTYLQMSTVRPGTLRWAAPEHFTTDEKGSEHNIKSDIYSFGNMSFLLLSGKYPWSEVRTDAAVMLQLSLGRKPGRPLVPPLDDQHWTFIEQCWSSVSERPLAESMVSSLQQLLGAYPPSQTICELLSMPASSSILSSMDVTDNVVPTQSPLQSRAATESRTSPLAQENIMLRLDVLTSSLSHVPRPSSHSLIFDTQPLTSAGQQQRIVNRLGEDARTHDPHEESYNRSEDLTDISSDSPPSSKWVRHSGTLLGRGTYGRVYLALDDGGEMIAVKQVEKGDKDMRHLDHLAKLKMEEEILRGLDHPNIVAYLGSEETPTFRSIFLEYVPGGSIASCLREHGKFDEQVTKFFTAQILDGLAYIHGKDIIHRNIEANNILVYPSGVCKISGFGNARHTNHDEASWTPMRGTVFWTAPEMIESRDRRCYGPKVDIWSAGCIILRMWLGGRVWGDREVFALKAKATGQLTGTTSLLALGVTLSDLAVDFSDQCFALDPEARASAAELVRHPYLRVEPDWTFTGFKTECT